VKLIFLLTLTTLAGLQARAQEGTLPPLDDNEQKKVIADVTARALQYSMELPDFTCTVVMRTNEDPTGTSRHWKLLDTVHEEITYRGGKEEYKEVSVNGKKESRDSKPANMVTPIDFAQAISWVFDPKYHADVAWGKWDSLRGHRVHEIAYTIKPENSQFTVGGKKQIKAGAVGIIAADSDTGALLKLTALATGLPKNSPIAAHSVEFNYDFAKIGDHFYLLPLRAEVQSREGKKALWYEYDFKDYRKP
jgi:hypothetical protein